MPDEDVIIELGNYFFVFFDVFCHFYLLWSKYQVTTGQVTRK